jgi:hypothetical protein
MGTKRAKLNLDFGHSGVSMNYAKANDFQPRYGMESYWNVGTLKFNTEVFEDFPGVSHHRVDESRIKIIDETIDSIISQWQKESGYDFDALMEVTISAAFFDVLFFPYNIEFAEVRSITADDIRKIEHCKLSEKMLQIPIPDEKLKSLTSPYYTVLSENGTIKKMQDPKGWKTKCLGFNAYFITKHPMLSKLLDFMKEAGEKINISLSCEKEFMALANKKEMEGKTALIHITDFMSEFSVWERSELKYLNKKDFGFRELMETIWRLCICYHKNPKLMEMDFELTQNIEHMKRFYKMVKTMEISEDSRLLLSADDCLELLENASCVLENETEESIKYSRLELPGKSGYKTGLTISNYVFCYFVREAFRSLLMEIKQTMYSDNFCQPESIILECPLLLRGVEKLVNEVFEIPARKAIVIWDGEIRGDLSSAGAGALKNLISGSTPKDTLGRNKKKTEKISSLIRSIFSRGEA